MKYYLIAGEASGDLHAANLMEGLKREDVEAEFRFYGGDKMAAVGGTLVKHYRELAYMGFIPVLVHLPQILQGMRQCKADIEQWHPNVVILVDYPGFNLDIAKFVHERGICKVFYYISPKIWAWKEYRIKRIKRDVDEMFSILPFEEKWFAERGYPVHYVGNPTASEVHRFLEKAAIGNDDFMRHNVLSDTKPIIAVLCGSRRQEIKDNLPMMLEATDTLGKNYQIVVAGAPSIEHEYYSKFTQGHNVTVLHPGWTYQLLYNATAALVTSGTATLETAIMKVPQVVCYATPIGKFISWLRSKVLKVKYISLVNLIADKEVVKELVADLMTKENIVKCLNDILPGGGGRNQMLRDYDEVDRQLMAVLVSEDASERAAKEMVKQLRQVPTEQ